MTRRLGVRSDLNSPGHGRKYPQIPAKTLLWAVLIGQLLREATFYGVESLVRSRLRRALGVGRKFGDDALAYFTERLDVARCRAALVWAMQRAKRNKAFSGSRFIGLAVDGSTGGEAEGFLSAVSHGMRYFGAIEPCSAAIVQPKMRQQF